MHNKMSRKVLEMKNIMANGKRGFTLVELLVVIAIIALLLSILMPSLGRVRKQGQKVVCGSNMRQMGTALGVYTSSYKDAMPPLYERHWGDALVAGLAGNGQGRVWAGVMKDETKLGMEIFKCPADKRKLKLDASLFLVPRPGVNIFSEFSYGGVCIGYGLPNWRVPWSMPQGGGINNGVFKQFSIPQPARMSLVWDSGIALVSYGGGTMSGLRNLMNINMVFPDIRRSYNETLFRHRKNYNDITIKDGPNSLFADGHVETAIDFSKLADDSVSIRMGR